MWFNRLILIPKVITVKEDGSLSFGAKTRKNCFKTFEPNWQRV